MLSKGLAKYEKDWAKVLWYKNELSENDLDDLFLIDEIKKKLPKNAEFGNRNGGTTIQLPSALYNGIVQQKVYLVVLISS